MVNNEVIKHLIDNVSNHPMDASIKKKGYWDWDMFKEFLPSETIQKINFMLPSIIMEKIWSYGGNL